jgi:hypothetical protein
VKTLSSLVEGSVYEDAPFFSDSLLLPAIVSGHSVTLVTAFAPSYLYRLVNDLATSPEIEPGKLHVVFCVPFPRSKQDGLARVLSQYLSAFAGSSQEVKQFLTSLLQLVSEGGLSLGALFANQNQLLTPSCIGVIESNEVGSGDYLSLIDRTAGDLNSPIPIGTSWGAQSPEHSEIVRLVGRAVSENFTSLLRSTHSEVLEMIREILKKGYPRIDLAERDKLVAKESRKRSSSPGKTKSSRKSTLDEDEDDFDLDDLAEDLDGFIDQETREIDRLIAEINRREAAYFDFGLGEFLEGSFEFEDQPFRSSGRSHAAPLSVEIAEMVGHGYAVCWCGQDFDRAAGCPDYLY